MELDLYLPSLALAFEYQGVLHYKRVPFYNYKGVKEVQSRDKEKRKACHSLGITLIEVPHWWNRRIESLIATVSVALQLLLLSRYKENDLILRLTIIKLLVKTVRPKYLLEFCSLDSARIDY